jgi:hypothetical protein
MNSKTWSIVAVALVISNLVLVGFLFFDKAKPKHEGPKNHIIEVLHLDQAQVAQYDILIADHQKQIREQEGQLMNAKNALYATVVDEPSDSLIQGLKMNVSSAEEKIQDIHLNHFREIKKLCKPEQLPAFESLMNEVGFLFAPGPKRK